MVVVLLAGCSTKNPLATNLRFTAKVQREDSFKKIATAALNGQDARADSAVVIYRLPGKPEIRIPNSTPPHLLVTEQYARGLMSEGLVFEAGAPVRIQLKINELVAVVNRPDFLYKAKARSNLTLTVTNRQTTLSRTYDRQANHDSIGRPAVEDLEKLLNEQLTDIVNQMLQDKEVQATIEKGKT